MGADSNKYDMPFITEAITLTPDEQAELEQMTQSRMLLPEPQLESPPD